MTERPSPPSSPPSFHRLSRRLVIVVGALVLVGGAGAAVTLAVRDDGAGTTATRAPAPSPARSPAVSSASLRAVLAEADATAGMRLLASPWARWAGRADGSDGADASGWDGLWVAWLLRRHGGDPRATRASDLLALVRAGGEVDVAPRAGALVFYDRDPDGGQAAGVESARVGLVTSVTGASLAQTLEADHPAPLPHSERFVRRLARPGPGPLVFAMPAYRPLPEQPLPDEPSEDR